MVIKFRTYNGLSGDPQLLLIAETDCGIRYDTLFNRASLFNLSFYFARKKLIRRIKNKRFATTRLLRKNTKPSFDLTRN